MLTRRSFIATTTNPKALHAFVRSDQPDLLSTIQKLSRRNGSPNQSARLRLLHQAVLSTPASDPSQGRRGLPCRRVARRQARCVVTRSWSSLGASRAWHTGLNKMASGSASADKKGEKSTWASAVDSINPWAGSRSTTPVPKESAPAPPPPPPPPPNPGNSGGDHSINLIYGLSAKKYPSDCPPLKVKWFHAVDVWEPDRDTVVLTYD